MTWFTRFLRRKQSGIRGSTSMIIFKKYFMVGTDSLKLKNQIKNFKTQLLNNFHIYFFYYFRLEYLLLKCFSKVQVTFSVTLQFHHNTISQDKNTFSSNNMCQINSSLSFNFFPPSSTVLLKPNTINIFLFLPLYIYSTVAEIGNSKEI